jgi:hypothetical protein
MERGTLLATGFYMAGSKMAPCSQVGMMFLGQVSMASTLFYVTRLDFVGTGSPNEDLGCEER